MIGAVIYYGKNTLVAELPMGTLDLQMKLSSIGVGEPADRIPLKDDEERQLQVKLYASSPEEAHLLSLLTPNRSLADANTCADLLWQAEQRALPRLKCGLLADSYRSMDEFVEAAKKVFADCQTQETIQAGKSEDRDAVLEEFKKNPNIRVVVSCTRVVGVEYFPLPMNDPQLSAVFNRLDELGEGMYSLGIEACRYKDHWPDTFGEVLREEGLFALNALAAAFPPMEDYDKFCAVVEYADANTSKEYIALADHLDEFEFFPGARDLDDMAETWIDAHPYLNLSAELEEYFDFSAYGGDLQDEYDGKFVSNGYVYMEGSMRLENILDEAQDMDME